MKQAPTPEVPWTELKISTTDPNEWYLHFRFFHEGKWSPTLKFREGINRIKDLKKRSKEADQLRLAREAWLKMGWNPIADPKFKLRQIKTKHSESLMTVNDAIDFGFGKRKEKLASKSISGYGSMLKLIKQIASQTGYSLLPIKDLDRFCCLDLIDECAKARNFSNHNYNKHVSCLRSILSELVNYRQIQVNPLLGFEDKPVPESNKYADYTPLEKESIENFLWKRKKHPQLFIVMSLVYHTGIRPKEVLALKIEDFNQDTKLITIAPDTAEENSKTKNVRRIPINPHLFALLMGMNLDQYPKSYYMFGTPFSRGVRWTNLSGQSKLLKFDNDDRKEFKKDTAQV